MSIPLFPLSIVQFPGVLTPLHIFEQRYRDMLRDVMAGTRVFGIVLISDSPNGEPTPGDIGCTVEVVSVQELEDGRSNILCIGRERFRILSLSSDRSYFRGEVDYFQDDPVHDLSPEKVDKAKALFLRIVKAGNEIRKAAGQDGSIPPELPSEPESLSFLIAASLEADLEARQRWLEMTSTQRRLSILTNLLTEIVETYELRAQLARISRRPKTDTRST